MYARLCRLLCLTLLATTMTRAETMTFRLQDWLNKPWHHELITWPVTFAESACLPGSLVLNGPDGRLPVNLLDIESWPDGSVKAAELAWVADLEPLAGATFTLDFGTRPAPPLATTSDLRVTADDGQVELATRFVGIRLLAGQRVYDPPVAASTVPGPVNGLRLADGAWFGGSRLAGPGLVTAYQAELTASGPAAAAWVCRYRYADGRQVELTLRLGAGDSRLEWAMLVTPWDAAAAARLTHHVGFAEGERIADRAMPEDSWQLLLTTGREDLRMHTRAEFYNERNRWGQQLYEGGKWVFQEVDVPLAGEPPGRRAALVPWEDWWDGTTRHEWTFNTAAQGDLFRLVRNRAGDWVEPAPPGTWASWGNPRQRQKWVYLVKADDGAFAADFNLASGWRHWFFDALPEAQPKNDRPLNELKNWVLDWPDDPAVTHPHLYLNASELAEVRARGPVDPALVQRLASRWKSFQGFPHGSDADALGLWLLDGSPEFAAQARLVERFRHHLGLLGNFDRMRFVGLLVALYDALIDTELISPADKPTLRGQMAYLGYLMADPVTWSMERGFCSGNQNMSVSYTLNLGMVAAVIPDHPLARQWAAPAQSMTEKWLAESVGPEGEWPESVCNYAHVSASAILPFAIAAHHAGFHHGSDFQDFIDDPRLKKLFLWLAKYYTPPDPRSGGDRQAGVSGTAPLGRAGAGARFGLAGAMARATRDLDPAYSRVQQWSWLLTGKQRQIANTQMGGWEYVYLDDTLPAEQPDWGFGFFPQTGTIMRHGLGTPHEWYVNFMIEYNFGYPSESGSFPCIWARGVPIQSRFAGGYAEREEILLSRVLPARASGTIEERMKRFFHEAQRRITDYSAMPRQDYVCARLTIEHPKAMGAFGGHSHSVDVPPWPPVEREGGFPIEWTRQVLFVKDADPAAASYLVLRDTVRGNQPTMWQFWTISRKLGTPAEVADRDAFLATQADDVVTEPRPLAGDRFTAIGQFGVDIEYYVASPAATPRHTLRWGRGYGYSPIHQFKEYQDLLHLQLPGDGAYFVAIFPRRPDEPVPVFSTLADGHVIKVSGSFGTDYAFLAGEPATATADGIAFTGTAGSVQDRPSGLVLSLASAGSISHGDRYLACDQGVSLDLSGEYPILRLRDRHAGALVKLRLPGTWAVDTAKGYTIDKLDDGTLLIHLRAEFPHVQLYPEQ